MQKRLILLRSSQRETIQILRISFICRSFLRDSSCQKRVEKHSKRQSNCIIKSCHILTNFSDTRSSIKDCRIQTVQSARQVPLLPVPQISETIERYLQALKPLIPDFQYEKVAKYADEFLLKTANKLQILLEARARYVSLILITDQSPFRTRINWATDWWLNDMYFEQNAPLPINSNPGMIVHRNYSRSRSENVTLIATIIKTTLRYKTKGIAW